MAADNDALFPPNHREMMDVLGAWMNRNVADSDVAARANDRMRRVLFRHLIDLPEPPETDFPPDVKAQASVMMGYIAMSTLIISFRECEHYFRRYPFRGMSVGRADHLRNCCGMYCDRFAQFRDRMKATLNAVNKLNAGAPVAAFLKAFDKTFAQEIRARNYVHHHGRYDDDGLSQLAMVELFERVGKQDDLFLPRSRSLYQKESNRWIDYVRIRSTHLTQFLEEIAAILLRLDFIQPLRGRKTSLDRETPLL